MNWVYREQYCTHVFTGAYILECYRGDSMIRMNIDTHRVHHNLWERQREWPLHITDTLSFSVSVSLRVRSIIIIVCTWFLMPRDLFIQWFKDVFVFFPYSSFVFDNSVVCCVVRWRNLRESHTRLLLTLSLFIEK